MADELIDVDKEGDLLGSDVVAVDSKETVEGVAEDKTVDETVEDSSDASKDGAVEDSSGKDEEDLLDDLPELSAADESETTPDSPSLGKDTTSADNVDAQHDSVEDDAADDDAVDDDDEDDDEDDDAVDKKSTGTSIGVELTEEELAALDAEIAAQLDAEDQEDSSGDEWYFVHTYSGMENKVKKNLEHRTESMGMADRILQVVVPTETEVEIRKGVRKEVEKRVFPGYILVNMVVDEDSWYVVRNTPGVTGFVGMGNKPTPLSPEEVSRIMERLDADEPRVKVSFQLGEQVRITGGPFAEFNGVVEEIYADKGKAKVMVSFFNRETPVEVDFIQLEREEIQLIIAKVMILFA